MPYNPSADKELFQQIARGEESAFRQIFYAYGKMLLPFVVKLTGSESASEEVLQNVFLKIWLHRRKLASVHNPKAWIIRLVSNESLNYLRKQAAEGRLFSTLQQAPATNDLSPENTLDAKETATIINDCINRLPPKCREVYLLSREQGLSIPAIAAKLGLSHNTVKNQLVKALQLMRTYLKRLTYLLANWLV